MFRIPTSRYEVLKLRETLKDMLKKAGILDQELNIKGPTQVFYTVFKNDWIFFVCKNPVILFWRLHLQEELDVDSLNRENDRYVRI